MINAEYRYENECASYQWSTNWIGFGANVQHRGTRISLTGALLSFEISASSTTYVECRAFRLSYIIPHAQM